MRLVPRQGTRNSAARWSYLWSAKRVSHGRPIGFGLVDRVERSRRFDARLGTWVGNRPVQGLQQGGKRVVHGISKVF